MERGKGGSELLNITRRSYRLPTEIIYTIIAYLTGEYLDDVIAGPNALPPVNMDDLLNQQALIPQNIDAPQMGNGQDDAHAPEAMVLALEFPNSDNDDDPACNAPNPFVSLLQTSTQIRAVALLVLSDALGIPLRREGVHRLTSKPWTRIHMVRTVFSNPMTFVRMRRDHDFTSIMRSSGVITTYVSLGVDIFQLALATRVIESPSNTDPIVMFVACRARVTALLESLETTLHGPLSIPYDALRISAYKRVMAWSFSVGKFLVFKVYMPATRGVFELFLKLEETAQMCERASVNVPIAESSVENAYCMLDGMLHGLSQAAGLVSRLPKQFDSPSNQEDVRIAVDLMNRINGHTARDDTKFTECRSVATIIRDWLVDARPIARSLIV